MSSIPNEFPISLKSWPASKKDEASALPTRIARINFERGGFKDISEESLRQEIAEAEANGEDGPSEEEEEEEEEPDRVKEVMAARDEILGQIETANQAAGQALDFISLLLSKDNPVQAALSMSPALKELVGTGTLGATKLNGPQTTPALRENNRQVAKGWKIQNLTKTVDNILASATKLEQEIETETKYWEQVLAVSTSGWAVCRLPGERHTLGVRYGFSEAAPTFKNQSLAALRRKPDGSLSLDQGIMSTEPQALRVRIQVDGVDTGSSSIPAVVAEDAPIESLILQARNTIFTTELWQELNREARTLGALNVRATDEALIVPLGSTKRVVLDLVSLVNPPVAAPQPSDDIAKGVSLALHLQLCFAHRQNLRRRTQPPPPISSQKRPNLPYNLLRPLITRMNHQQTISALNSLFTSLTTILTSASLSPKPSYTMIHSPPTPPPIPNLSLAEKQMWGLIDRLESILTFRITLTTTLTLTVKTSQYTAAGSIFNVSLNPESELNRTCAAITHPSHLGLVEEYICYATSCALASHFSSQPTDEGLPVESEKLSEGKEGWYATAQANVLRKIFQGGKGKQLIFDIKNKKSKDAGKGKGVKLRVGWDFMRHENFGVDVKRAHTEKDRKIGGEGVYEWSGGGKDDMEKMWDDGEGEVVRSLGEVVEGAGKWIE
ncbi:subunit 17 of mediator complex-domain-containing protein [Halenospora varia]|nr:subunit 17 of mediator complex-domain-containing protein [Halenospora varia]